MFCIANALGSENIEFYSEGEKKKQNKEFCVGGVNESLGRAGRDH